MLKVNNGGSLSARYLIKTVQMDGGERIPLLVDSHTGLGVFEVTAFSLSMRSKGNQVNTLLQAMAAVQFLYDGLDEYGINLMQRASANELLTLGEVESLVARCRFVRDELLKADLVARSSNVSAINHGLGRSRITGRRTATVTGATTAIRLHYIIAYLNWFCDYVYLLRLPSNREEFQAVSTKVIGAIKNRIPTLPKARKRKGLTTLQEQRLLAVTAVSSLENPWTNTFVRNRNSIIIRIMLAVGVRKGELLGLKVDDIDFGNNTIFVARRPDDSEDPRIRQPQAKTASRILPIASTLAQEIKKYMVGRNVIPKARKHPFVFVSSTGAPIALNSIDALFSGLKEHFPELASTSAHILRHTWNDRFSEMVEGVMSEAEERQLRNYLMGWSDKSRMAENYTARYVEKRAKSALLKLQDIAFRGVN